MRAQELGFAQVELVIQASDIDFSFDRQVRMDFYRKLRRILRDHSIGVGSVHSPFLNGTDAFSAKSRVQILQHSAEITQMVQGDTLVLHPYHIFSSYEGAIRFFSAHSRRVEELLLPKFLAFLRKAKNSNITIAIENIAHWYDHPLTNNPSNLMKLVKALDNDSVRAVIDIYHSEFVNATLHFFQQLGEFITAVHLSDISTSRARALPGQGETDWRALAIAINRLPELRHKVLEGPSYCGDADLKRSARFLEPLFT